ncbi:hypothetical protein [Arthrobacter rhombi]|uniref:hypothetical protein n=1 Tax=Arthrobacter rhombi TaxID=71253 RepID=UPI003FD66C6F
MGLDTAGLEGWPDPASISAAAASVSTAGGKYDDKIENAADDWTPIGSAYRQGAGRGEVLRAFSPVKDHGEAIRTASGFVRDALDDFAADVVALKARRKNVLLRVDAFNTKVANDEEMLDYGYSSETGIQATIDAIAQDLKDRANECAQALKDITIKAKPGGGFLASPEGGLVTGSISKYMKLNEVASFSYTELHVNVQTYTFSHQDKKLRPWVRLWNNGKFDPGAGVWRYDTTTHHVTVISMEEIERKGTWKPNWTPTDIRWRQWIEGKSKWYGNYAANRAGHWQQPSSASWLDDFKNAGKGTKFLKGGNVALSLATTGLTYVNERDKEYNRLLQENPGWSDDKISDRAREVGAVKTTAKTTVDFGAGMAGAAVGTMIGGPVGTVIGFGVGMGLSYLSNKSGASDFVADKAVEVWDGAKDMGGKAKDWVGGLFD